MSESDRQSKLPVVRVICRKVADHFGVTVPWMMAQKNSKIRVRCRYLAIALIHRDSKLSISEIAEEFLIDHTTVIHALKRVKDFDEYDYFFIRD